MKFQSTVLIFASAIVCGWSHDSRELVSRKSKSSKVSEQTDSKSGKFFKAKHYVDDGAKGFKLMQSTKSSKSKNPLIDELESRLSKSSKKSRHDYDSSHSSSGDLLSDSLGSQHPSALPSSMMVAPSIVPTFVPSATPSETSSDIPSLPPTMVPTTKPTRRVQRTALPTTRTLQPVGIKLETLEPTAEPTKPSRFQWDTLEPTFELTDPLIVIDSEPTIDDDLTATAPFVSPTFGPTEFETREPTIYISPTFGPTEFETREPTLVASFGESVFPTYPPIAAFIESDGIEIEVPPEREDNVVAIEKISSKTSKTSDRRTMHVTFQVEPHRGRGLSGIGKASKISKMSKAAKIHEMSQPIGVKRGKNNKAKLGIGEMKENRIRSKKIETNEDFEVDFDYTDAFQAKKRAKAFASKEGKRDLTVA